MNRLEELIDELVDMILMQYDEICKLKEKIKRMKQHIDMYEEIYKDFTEGEK